MRAQWFAASKFGAVAAGAFIVGSVYGKGAATWLDVAALLLTWAAFHLTEWAAERSEAENRR